MHLRCFRPRLLPLPLSSTTPQHYSTSTVTSTSESERDARGSQLPPYRPPPCPPPLPPPPTSTPTQDDLVPASILEARAAAADRARLLVLQNRSSPSKAPPPRPPTQQHLPPPHKSSSNTPDPPPIASTSTLSSPTPPPLPPNDSSTYTIPTITTLPSTEPQLFSLLVRLSRELPPVPPPWLAWFHAAPQFHHIVSLRSYTLLLDLIYTSSDLSLAREVLLEMDDRGIKPAENEAFMRVQLRSRVRRGDGEGVHEVVERMRRELGINPVVAVNERRDLGDRGKGKGDWAASWKDGRGPRPRKAADQTIRASDHPRRTSRRSVAASLDSTTTFDSLQGLLRRQPTRIPVDVTRLANNDISTLVESLVQDRRAPEAFTVAETWLISSRQRLHSTPPNTSSSSPSFRSEILYHRTSIVLLNMLLKSLFSSSASDTSIRQFLLSFASTHHLSHHRTHRLTTLRTLVSGFAGSKAGWERATKMVDWFAREWGLPVSRDDEKVLEWFKKEVTVGTGRSRRKAAFEHGGPLSQVEGTTAMLLLRLAVDRKKSIKGEEEKAKWLVDEVRGWWNGLKGQKEADQAFWTRDARLIVDDAVKCGLLSEGDELRLKRSRQTKK